MLPHTVKIVWKHSKISNILQIGYEGFSEKNILSHAEESLVNIWSAMLPQNLVIINIYLSVWINSLQWPGWVSSSYTCNVHLLHSPYIAQKWHAVHLKKQSSFALLNTNLLINYMYMYSLRTCLFYYVTCVCWDLIISNYSLSRCNINFIILLF